MINILVVTHGNFGNELIKSAEMIAGKQENIEALGLFVEDDFDMFKSKVKNKIKELENELEATDCAEEFRFTPKDILLKRDIDFLNKLKLNKEYQERTKTWKDYTREEQAELIMKYVDDIELDMLG